jgi:hypothetical protein
MATTQVDVTPASGPVGLNIHFHSPAGASASQFNNPADFPATVKGATAVAVKVSGVRFSNPS